MVLIFLFGPGRIGSHFHFSNIVRNKRAETRVAENYTIVCGWILLNLNPMDHHQLVSRDADILPCASVWLLNKDLMELARLEEEIQVNPASDPVDYPPTINRKYDVFLSFRGEDTHHWFIDHLTDALQTRGISSPAIMLETWRRSSSKTSDYSDSWGGFSSNSTWNVSLKARDHSMNNRANMRKASWWITVLTFPYYRQSLERKPAIMRSKSKTSYYSDSWGGFSSNSTGDVSLKARDHSMNNRANMQNASWWITVLTFPWCLLQSNYRQSLERKPAIMRRSSKTSYYSNSLGGFSSNSTSDVSLKARDHNVNNRANMQRASSWITVLTFPWCLLQSNYRQSLCNEKSSLSIWHALLGMINFTAFLSSLFLMAICGAHFTRLQISVLLISSTIIIMDVYAPVVGLSN